MKKRFLSIVVASLTLAFAFSACIISGEDPPSRPEELQPGVYSVGEDTIGQPTIWRDGSAHVILDTDGYFKAITVSNGILYAVGMAYDRGLADWRPMYYRSNDPRRYYYLGTGPGEATSVDVVGGMVYIAGWDSSGGKVWRNGVTHNNLGSDAYPWSIRVSGNHQVFTGGWDTFGGCIWLDGVWLDGIDHDTAYIYSIDLAYGAVYAVGEFNGRPVWFKTNDIGTHYLGSGLGWATSVRIFGGNMCVAGMDATGGKVWRGAASGTSTTQLYSLGAYAEPESVSFGWGTRMYVGGYDGSVSRSRIWEDGNVRFNLDNRSKIYSIYAYSGL